MIIMSCIGIITGGLSAELSLALAGAGIAMTIYDAKISITEIVNAFNKYYSYFEINTCLRRAHFFAQVREEAGADLCATEGLNYNVNGLKNTFSYFKNNPEEAEKYGRVEGKDGHKANQKEIANRAYSNKLGNGDINSGDGWKYRGGGLIQVTGKCNYNDVNKTIKEQCPSFKNVITGENASNSEEAVISGMAFWYKKGLNQKSDMGATDNVVDSIIDIINKNTNSRQERKNYFNKIKTKWNLDSCIMNSAKK